MKAERRSSLPFYLKLNTETARVAREENDRVNFQSNNHSTTLSQYNNKAGSNLRSLVAMKDLMKNPKMNETVQKSSKANKTNVTSNETSKYLNSSTKNRTKLSPSSDHHISSFRSSSEKKSAEEHVQELFDDYIQKTEFQNNYKRIKVETIKVESVEDFKQYIKDRFQVECGEWGTLELMTFLVQNYFLLEVNKLSIEEQVTYLCQKLVKLEETNLELESTLANFRNQTNQLNFELAALYSKAQEEKNFHEKVLNSHKGNSERISKVIDLFRSNKASLEQNIHLKEFLTRMENLLDQKTGDEYALGPEKRSGIPKESGALQLEGNDSDVILRKYKQEIEGLDKRLRLQMKENDFLKDEVELLKRQFERKTLEDISEGRTTLESEGLFYDTRERRLMTEEAKDGHGKEKNNRCYSLIQKELASIKESLEIYKKAVLTKIKSDGNCFENENDYNELLMALKRIRDEKLSSELSVLFVKILEKFKQNYKKLHDEHIALNEKFHSREDQKKLRKEDPTKYHHQTIFPLQIISPGIQPTPYIQWRGISPVRPGVFYPKQI